MKTVYIASILLWWLSFLFGKSQAQMVSLFSTHHTNGDIEMSSEGNLWGISNRFSIGPDHESGFEKLNMTSDIMQYLTYPNKDFRHIAVSPQYVYITEPDSNRIYVYTHLGQELNVIETVDNPGNVFADADNHVYVIETDVKKISRFTPQGQKTVICADPLLTHAYTLTGDAEGNLFTANRYTGQIYRWEKASQQLYPYAVIPTGTLCEDGSQISEMVFKNGKLYVASVGLAVIYQISETGDVLLLAGGPGQQGSLNDVGSKARFMRPVGLAISVSGDTLFVTDEDKIRMISHIATAGMEEQATKQNLTVYPNPSTDFVNIKLGDDIKGRVDWKLLGVDGKVTEQGQAFPSNGVLSLHFNPSDCSNYFLLLSHNGNPMVSQPIYLCNQ